MTPAEQKLWDYVLSREMFSNENVEKLSELRRDVLMESLPEGFEENLRALAFRAAETNREAFNYSLKHPLGEELLARFRKEWRQREPADK